jgi:hypothetical protein
MARTWAFAQRRKMLRLLAISQRPRRITFLVGLVLLLAFVVWLGLSGNTHAWSARSWILAHPQPIPEVLLVLRNSCSPRVVAAAQVAGSTIAGTNCRESL